MRTRSLPVLAALALAALPPQLPAATSGVSPSGFTITVERDIPASPQRVYAALGEVGKWWNKDHSWSGEASNLSMELKAGGCFCERWGKGSVEHGRVINATQDQLLRLRAPLGPLQALPVSAVLSFQVAAAPAGAKLTVTYVIAGGGMDLSQLAAPVDGVITEQVTRLARFLSPP